MNGESNTTDALTSCIVSRLKRFGQDSLQQNTDMFGKIEPAAHALVTDIERYPHAFVLACIADRRAPFKIAWGLPQRIREFAGGFEFERLARLPRSGWSSVLRSSGHPLANAMERFLPAAIEYIGYRYDGDAARIWAAGSSGAAVVRRFLEFDGVGSKIANMAANILIRKHGVTLTKPMPDIAVDTHVLRVFERLGLLRPLAHSGLSSTSTKEKQQLLVQLRARELRPAWPGELDWPVWQVGSKWCHARAPKCRCCDMRSVCPSAGSLD